MEQAAIPEIAHGSGSTCLNSSVQRLDLEDGRRLIYKAEFGLTVEPQFYACARSDLLVDGRTVYQAGHLWLAEVILDRDMPALSCAAVGSISGLGRSPGCFFGGILDIGRLASCLILISSRNEQRTYAVSKCLNHPAFNALFYRARVCSARYVMYWLIPFGSIFLEPYFFDRRRCDSL